MKNIFSSQTYFLISLGFIFCLFAIVISSCMKENELVVNGPAPEPKLPATPFNYINGNDHTATLGRVLFYDRNLSLNNAISCGSCHKQQFAFADNRQFSRGLNNGLTSRNASTLLSSGNHKKFWDGRAGNFDTAVFMPVMNQLEMHVFNLNMLPDRLSKTTYYPDLFEAAYGDPAITVSRIRTALALFANNLISQDSKFDNENLTAFEEQGEELFEGKAQCYNCHEGKDFNGYSTRYENIGLDINYADKGRSGITQNAADDGKFTVQTLRNIELTAPYMHDGRYKTLREVIDHYNNGVQPSKNLSYTLKDFSAFENMTEEELLALFDTNHDGDISEDELPEANPVKLNLTEEEKKALEAFLRTLTDVNFITDPKYSNPF